MRTRSRYCQFFFEVNWTNTTMYRFSGRAERLQVLESRFPSGAFRFSVLKVWPSLRLVFWIPCFLGCGVFRSLSFFSITKNKVFGGFAVLENFSAWVLRFLLSPQPSSILFLPEETLSENLDRTSIAVYQLLLKWQSLNDPYGKLSSKITLKIQQRFFFKNEESWIKSFWFFDRSGGRL